MPRRRESDSGYRSGGGTGRPARSGDGQQSAMVAQALGGGVIQRSAIESLQHTAGNQGVQSLLAVQRKPLLLDDDAFTPELAGDLDQRLHMTGEDTDQQPLHLDDDAFTPELAGDLDQRFHMTGEEAGAPETANEPPAGGGGRTKMSFLTKLSNRLLEKRSSAREKGRSGAGWGFLGSATGLMGKTVDAYRKGGLHEAITKRNRTLRRAEKALKAGNVQKAAELTPRYHSWKGEGTAGKRAKMAITSPVVYARIAAQRAKNKELWRKLDKLGLHHR